MIPPRILDPALWRCFFPLLAAVVTGNKEALTNVERNIEAAHAQRNAQ